MKNSKHFFIICSTVLLVISSIMADAQSKSGRSKTSESTKYTIENCINRFSIERIEKTEAGYQYWFADPNFAHGKTLKMSVVAPHQATHPPHIHSEDEFFFILEGKAEFYLKGKWTQVEPYTSLYCPSNVEHGIRNSGDTELKYLVIKNYAKANPVRMEYKKNQGSAD